MLVPLVPTSFDHFPGMGFVFLFRGIMKKPYVIVDVKVEERSRFSPGFIDNEIVECVMLNNCSNDRYKNLGVAADVRGV